MKRTYDRPLLLSKVMFGELGDDGVYTPPCLHRWDIGETLVVTEWQDGTHGILCMDKNSWVLPCVYGNIVPLGADVCGVCLKKGKWALFSSTSEEFVSPFEYERVEAFEDGEGRGFLAWRHSILYRFHIHPDYGTLWSPLT